MRLRNVPFHRTKDMALVEEYIKQPLMWELHNREKLVKETWKPVESDDVYYMKFDDGLFVYHPIEGAYDAHIVVPKITRNLVSAACLTGNYVLEETGVDKIVATISHKSKIIHTMLAKSPMIEEAKGFDFRHGDWTRYSITKEAICQQLQAQ